MNDALGENILFDPVKYAAELDIKHFVKDPKVGAKKKGRPKKISSDRTHLTKADMSNILIPRKLLQ